MDGTLSPIRWEGVQFAARHIALYNENNPRGTYFVHPNALGSDSNWTDSHGQTTGEQIYSPWGHKLVAGGYVDRFAGLSHRDQTGFDVTPARDYSSLVNRWVTPDAAGVTRDNRTSQFSPSEVPSWPS